MPDYEFEPFESWVRFDFDAYTRAGVRLWSGARTRRAQGCQPTHRWSDDAAIEPPLSAAELAYQCGDAPPPCALRWQPGRNCFELPAVNWTLPSGEAVPGLAVRAAALGYRLAAAVSGTTANVLQMARLLGFSPAECVPLRLASNARRRSNRRPCYRSCHRPCHRLCHHTHQDAHAMHSPRGHAPALPLQPPPSLLPPAPFPSSTVIAWLLPVDDHSLYEVLVAAEP